MLNILSSISLLVRSKRYLLLVLLCGFAAGVILVNTIQGIGIFPSPAHAVASSLDAKHTGPIIAVHKPVDVPAVVQHSVQQNDGSSKQIPNKNPEKHVGVTPSKPDSQKKKATTTIPKHIQARLKPGKKPKPKKEVESLDEFVGGVYHRAANLSKEMVLLADSVPRPRVTSVSCTKLINGDQTEMTRAKEWQEQNPKVKIPDEAYADLTKNCKKYQQERQYMMTPLSEEERNFPIAYSIVMFKDIEQTERLLRAIYQPQNYYCIHVDKKANNDIKKSMQGIADCFDNVFMASRQIDVRWAWFSVLEPELVCMEDLWNYTKWRYFINLTGQEFPLKTNRDLVGILKAYNGANDAEGTQKRRNVKRTEFVHNGFMPTSKRKDPQPHDVRLTKGSVHVTASRDFVDFILHNKIALDFREWVKDTGVPDETFFSSLNHSPHLGVPGAYTGEPETHPIKKKFLTRFKNWGTWPFDWECKGRRVRLVCIFATGDLPLLAQRPELFANKFYLDYEPLAYDCMEELHFNNTRDEVLGLRTFDTSFYAKQSFVKNHV